MARTDRPVLAPDGTVLYAPNPRDLVTHVSPEDNPHEGTLSVGGSWRPYPAADWYDVVVTVCGPREGARPPACGAHLQWTLSDDADIDEAQVWAAASDVVDAVQDGQSVLVACYTGQNRSGLVVALAMAHLYGMTGREVIDYLRAKRSPYVLCNPAFERYVLEAA